MGDGIISGERSRLTVLKLRPDIKKGPPSKLLRSRGPKDQSLTYISS